VLVSVPEKPEIKQAFVREVEAEAHPDAIPR
jgi:3-hydroxyacyl-CoA dehydrogenase